MVDEDGRSGMTRVASGSSARLRFRRIDVSARSALSAELAPEYRKGIYLYEFSDGTSYVGKSVNMVERHAQHVHEYKHRSDFVGVSILAAYFAPVPAEASDGELDELETLAIRRAERDGRNLRNVMKTSRPGGDAKLLLDLDGAGMRLLPWDRAERTAGLPPAPLPEATASQAARFEKLKTLSEYPEVVGALATYASETLQEAANTAGLYWVASAYPARKRTPAVCVTCGLLETLVVFADEGSPYGYLNLKRPEGSLGVLGVLPWHLARYDYKAASNVLTYEFKNLRELGRLLSSRRILDWSYRLNIECFRSAKSPAASHGNPLLMKAMLDG
ncbi:MAG: GIY-YIG nuclease family protein [Eggerthellaceae bacterium]|nr:GIY-YIG nuclease family protein [Eggerthellaceae bacterium]